MQKEQKETIQERLNQNQRKQLPNIMVYTTSVGIALQLNTFAFDFCNKLAKSLFKAYPSVVYAIARIQALHEITPPNSAENVLLADFQTQLIPLLYLFPGSQSIPKELRNSKPTDFATSLGIELPNLKELLTHVCNQSEGKIKIANPELPKESLAVKVEATSMEKAGILLSQYGFRIQANTLSTKDGSRELLLSYSPLECENIDGLKKFIDQKIANMAQPQLNAALEKEGKEDKDKDKDKLNNSNQPETLNQRIKASPGKWGVLSIDTLTFATLIKLELPNNNLITNSQYVKDTVDNMRNCFEKKGTDVKRHLESLSFADFRERFIPVLYFFGCESATLCNAAKSVQINLPSPENMLTNLLKIKFPNEKIPILKYTGINSDNIIPTHSFQITLTLEQEKQIRPLLDQWGFCASEVEPKKGVNLGKKENTLLLAYKPSDCKDPSELKFLIQQAIATGDTSKKNVAPPVQNNLPIGKEGKSEVINQNRFLTKINLTPDQKRIQELEAKLAKTEQQLAETNEKYENFRADVSKICTNLTSISEDPVNGDPYKNPVLLVKTGTVYEQETLKHPKLVEDIFAEEKIGENKKKEPIYGKVKLTVEDKKKIIALPIVKSMVSTAEDLSNVLAKYPPMKPIKQQDKEIKRNLVAEMK